MTLPLARCRSFETLPRTSLLQTSTLPAWDDCFSYAGAVAMQVGKSTILLAYRHLYQHLLRAVQYSKPARYEARDRLRAAFRHSARQDFNSSQVQKTLEFLEGAAKYRGLEHHILKNLMFVSWTRGPRGDMPPVFVSLSSVLL